MTAEDKDKVIDLMEEWVAQNKKFEPENVYLQDKTEWWLFPMTEEQKEKMRSETSTRDDMHTLVDQGRQVIVLAFEDGQHTLRFAGCGLFEGIGLMVHAVVRAVQEGNHVNT